MSFRARARILIQLCIYVVQIRIRRRTPLEYADLQSRLHQHVDFSLRSKSQTKELINIMVALFPRRFLDIKRACGNIDEIIVDYKNYT